MLPAIVIEKLPRLVRAIKLLPTMADADEAIGLADELSSITAMVAEKFTNDRTAEGIQRALMLTVGGMSLGLEHLVDDDSDETALDILIADGEWRDAALAYDRAFYLFDAATLDGARLAWKLLAGRDGVERRYWAQNEGRWTQQA